MKKFDSIRPYADAEVQAVLSRLINDKDVIKAFIAASKYKGISKYPLSSIFIKRILKKKIQDIQSVKEYQSIFESLVKEMIETKTSGFVCNGFRNLKKNESYLFISNHRDIAIDPALLNFVLHSNDHKTTNIAVGNNLMSEKWASDLMRLNKSFIIDRTGKSKREIYQGLHLASEYIEDSLLEKNDSIWIAQKQGRAKDGIDETDPALLKMIHLANRKSISICDYFNSLNFIQIAVSYEFDPNDAYKAKEVYAKKANQEYTKSHREDLESIANGISGQKGLIELNIGKTIKFNEESYNACAQLITNSIHKLYKLLPSNFAACDIQKIPYSIEHDFSAEQINSAKNTLNERAEGMEPEIRALLFQQYSNPVIEKEKAIS